MEFDPAPALTRGLQLLIRLDRDGACSLEHLVKTTQWPKTSVARLLRCLEMCGTVHRDQTTKRYHALMRMLPIDSGETFLRRVCGPVLTELCARTSETIELHRFKAKEIEMIDRCEPENVPVQVRARVGWRRPLDEMDALTQLVLAFGMPQDDWPQMAFWQWENGTKKEIAQSAARDVIARVRKQRLSWDEQPNPHGIARYAAPLLVDGTKLRGVIAIAQAFVPGRPHPDRKLLETLSEAAERISRTLELSAMTETLRDSEATLEQKK